MGLCSDPPADLRYTHPKSAIVIRRCCVAGFYLHVATHVDARLFASGSPLKTLMSIHLSTTPVKRGDSYIAGVCQSPSPRMATRRGAGSPATWGSKKTRESPHTRVELRVASY